MESYCQCLRCGKRIPIRPEMVGQTILCPSCLDRVYVTPAGQAPEKPKSAASTSTVEPSLSPSAAAALAKLKGPQDDNAQSLPIGVIAGVGGVAALVIIGGLLMWSSKPSKKAGQQASVPGAPPPLAIAPETEEPAATSPKTPAVLPSPGFMPARPPGPFPAVPANNPTFVPAATAQPLASAGPSSAPGSASPVALTTAPQPLGSNWAEVWRSPASTSSQPEALASLGETPTPWRIAVRSAAPDIRTPPNLVIEPESDPRTWTLKHVTGPLATAEKESLAMLRQDGPNLVFAWATPLASEQARRNVVNCLLEVSAGSVRRVAQLREPLLMKPIALDLAKENQTVETQIDDPPRPDALRLEITELSGFSSEAKLRGGVKTTMASAQPGSSPMPMPGMPMPGAPMPGMPRPSLPMSGIPMPGMPLGLQQPAGPQSLVIEFEEIPGLEIRLRLARAEATGKLAISIDPVLNEGPQDVFDLTTPKILDRLESEVQKPLSNAQRELGPAEAGMKRWLADEEKLKSNEPRTKDIQRHSKWRQNVQESANWAKKFEREVNDLKQKIKTYQTRIEVVTKLRGFLKDSHQQALIHYVVYSECGQPDLLLVDARNPR